ncbi:VP2 structural protein [Alphapolyomavirus sturnirae]|uniref:Minor capsid protein VP2 n=1 Tax=Alphapolyomavirus sturnirae TaxID=1606500 RepID=J7H6A8_9POLY|nr:VP2 structural protein [Alphapolyomavirus sturnirae]AFP94189.1 VP2 structural protein [Alphapolyomavirus sturnirae]
MGGVLSSIVDLIVLAVDLSAATGISIEAIVTGEALAALEAEVSSLMTVEALSGIEALETLGWSAEQFSQMSFLATSFNQAIGYGVVFQTVSGLSALIGAGVRLGLDISTANRSVLEAQLVQLFGKIASVLHVNLSHQFNPLDWCGSLHDNYPPELDALDISKLSKLGQILEVSRWVRQANFTEDPQQESGDVIAFYHAPGGAGQRTTPDWLLHLILRLNGAKEKTPLCS